MQYTAIHETIDGLEIVKGLSTAAPDPAATALKVAALAADTDEAKAVLSLRDSLAEVFKVRNSSIGPAYNVAQTNADAILLQFPTVTEALRAKGAELMEANTVYFQPRKGEDFITDEVYSAIVAVSGKANTAVKLDGTTVADFRGSTYWTQTKKGVWSSTTIAKIGETVPSGTTLDADLTADQKTEIAAQTEAARVAALPNPTSSPKRPPARPALWPHPRRCRAKSS